MPAVAQNPVKGKKKNKVTPKNKRGNPKDPVTGMTVEIEGITLANDVTYNHDSPEGKALLIRGLNGAATDETGRRLAWEEDPLTGIHSLESLPAGASYKWKFEFNKDYLVGTAQYFSGSWANSVRIVYKGDYTYSGKKMSGFTLDMVANVVADGYRPNAQMGSLFKLNSPWSARAPFTNASFEHGPATELAYYRDVASVAQMPALQSFEGGKFFYSGWESDPFSKNLL